MENKIEEKFSTRDLYLATTLVTMKFRISNVDYQIEGNKKQPIGYFGFDKTKELNEIVDKYWQGEIKVEPREFVTNLWSLKSMVMNEYKNPNNEISKKLSSN